MKERLSPALPGEDATAHDPTPCSRPDAGTTADASAPHPPIPREAVRLHTTSPGVETGETGAS